MYFGKLNPRWQRGPRWGEARQAKTQLIPRRPGRGETAGKSSRLKKNVLESVLFTQRKVRQ